MLSFYVNDADKEVKSDMEEQKKKSSDDEEDESSMLCMVHHKSHRYSHVHNLIHSAVFIRRQMLLLRLRGGVYQRVSVHALSDSKRNAVERIGSALFA